MRKFTIDEIRCTLSKSNIKLISEVYVNCLEKLIFEDAEGFYYNMTYHSFLVNDNFKLKTKFDLSNPFTIRNIKLWIKINKFQLELLSEEYLNSNDKLIFKDIEGYLYSISISELQGNVKRNNNISRKFDKSNKYTLGNIDLWCKLNNKQFKLLSRFYAGNNKKLQWKCLKEGCEEEFYASWGEISNGNGCGFCAGKQVGLSNCLATKNPQLSTEWHPTKNDNLTPWDVTSGSSTNNIWWKCKVCGNEWDAKISSRSNGNGCPQCNKSKGEKRCKEVFISNNFIEITNKDYDNLLDKNNNTYFIPQKNFNGLIGTGDGLLSYDFYLPKYNLLFEYQGEQHEKYIKWFHKSIKDFKKQVEHDKRKKEYAKDNSIKLLEIWYYDFKNIETILNNYLKELSENDDGSFYLSKKEVIT